MTSPEPVGSSGLPLLPDRILVADDGSEQAWTALEAAAAFARAVDAELLIINVRVISRRVAGSPPSPTMRERLRNEGESLVAARRDAIERRGGKVDRTIVRVAPRESRAIADVCVAEGIGLLVIGSRGRRWTQRRLLGDLTAALLRTAPCAVLVIREGQGLSGPHMEQVPTADEEVDPGSGQSEVEELPEE